MTTLLLDTHVLVWLLGANERLAITAREEIEAAAAQSWVWVSAITPWEIGMLAASGRLFLSRDPLQWVEDALALPGIKLAPLTPQIAVASARLPRPSLPDPADRIIVSTARHLGARLVTADRRLLRYARAGHLAALRAT
ncbi:MAG TPA: type II toxin-antitoxin system VapC family toxin [Quisquiliibacterium sp.]|nr:type II toxin-antitoxin system VapC family toxin [Quisquiliibacterium sp.]